MPHRGDHPGDRVGARSGRSAPGWAGTRAGRGAARQPVRPRRQGCRHRWALVRSPGLAASQDTASRDTASRDAAVSAVSAAFASAKAQGRAALVGYVPAGFPSVDGAIDAANAIAQAGADIIEIGLPYSDPLIDGPVIQEAVYRALTGGVHVADVLSTVEAGAAAGGPTLRMTYWNPGERYGVESVAPGLAQAGGSGILTPDLTPEAAADWPAAGAPHGPDP